MSTAHKPPKPLLTVREVAEALGCREDTLYRWISEGRSPLPVVRLGRSVRFRQVDLDRLVLGETA